MKKNALLTFIFACIPGAGQMYYGYMQRGLAIVSLFGVGFMVSTIFDPFIITLPILWMYSFLPRKRSRQSYWIGFLPIVMSS